MDQGPRWGLDDLYRRARRIERDELGAFRDWIEHTDNLIHVSVLVFLPSLIGLVTYLSNVLEGVLPFLLFPPLASGVYSLFADPESEASSPRRFVGGLTLGAACGWIALELATGYWYDVPAGRLRIHAGAAAFSVLLTGVLAWILDLEESAAFSTALLVLVTGADQPVYVLSVAVSTLLIAGVFFVWRERFYERRGEYLYQTTKGDDHVLVPVRGETADATAALGARLASAHDAGKIVLIDVLGAESMEAAHADLVGGRSADAAGEADQRTDGGQGDTDAAATATVTPAEAVKEAASTEASTDLEARSRAIESEFDVPCEVIVAFGGPDPGTTVLEAARDTNCDLIATPYGENGDVLDGFIQTLFRGDVDVLVHRSTDGESDWSNALVPVRKAGDVANAMIDFAGRLVGGSEVAVCHCIGSGRERRRAEAMLANLADTAAEGVETRISETPIEEFLGRNDDQYDIVFLGASTDRSAASRFVSKPTFKRVSDLDTDVAVVHRG